MSNLVNKIKDKVGHHSSEPNSTSHATSHATSNVKLVNKPIGPIGYGLMGK